jgi:hypothetical protein
MKQCYGKTVGFYVGKNRQKPVFQQYLAIFGHG